jgi:hypothetical protein
MLIFSKEMFCNMYFEFEDTKFASGLVKNFTSGKNLNLE